MKISQQIKGRFCEEKTYKLGLEVQAGEKRPVQRNRHLKEDTTWGEAGRWDLKRQWLEMKLEYAGVVPQSNSSCGIISTATFTGIIFSSSTSLLKCGI